MSLQKEDMIELYQKEAVLTLPSDIVTKTTNEIDTMFRVSSSFQIPTKKFIGINAARFCKDLIRKEQPAYFLYVILCFFTELSLAMLLYALAFCGIRFALSPSHDMPAVFPCYPGFFLLTGLTLYNNLVKNKFRRILKNADLLCHPVEQPANLKRSLKIFQIAAGLSIGLICILAVALFGLLHARHNAHFLYTTIVEQFMIYVCCMALFGIHNTMYQSLFIPFFNIGISVCFRNPKCLTQEKFDHYCHLSIEKIAKQINGSSSNDKVILYAQRNIRSRMVTYRIYLFLALFILTVLDIICIMQLLKSVITLAYIVFFLCSLAATLIFIVAFVSCNLIIRHLSKHKGGI